MLELKKWCRGCRLVCKSATLLLPQFDVKIGYAIITAAWCENQLRRYYRSLMWKSATPLLPQLDVKISYAVITAMPLLPQLDVKISYDVITAAWCENQICRYYRSLRCKLATPLLPQLDVKISYDVITAAWGENQRCLERCLVWKLAMPKLFREMLILFSFICNICLSHNNYLWEISEQRSINIIFPNCLRGGGWLFT